VLIGAIAANRVKYSNCYAVDVEDPS